MASGPFTWFNVSKPKATNGTILLGSHTFKAILTSVTPAFSNTYVGASGAAKYSDVIANEITGAGYTAGGVQVTLSQTANATTGAVTWNSTPAVWNPASLTAVYLVLVDASASNLDLVGYTALDSGLVPQTSANGAFQVTFSGGLLTY